MTYEQCSLHMTNTSRARRRWAAAQDLADPLVLVILQAEFAVGLRSVCWRRARRCLYSLLDQPIIGATQNTLPSGSLEYDPAEFTGRRARLSGEPDQPSDLGFDVPAEKSKWILPGVGSATRWKPTPDLLHGPRSGIARHHRDDLRPPSAVDHHPRVGRDPCSRR